MIHKIFTSSIMLCLIAITAFAQNRQISGTVTSGDNNNPLPGVTVLVKGTQTGTVTGANGQYTITAAPSDTLLFRYIGYTEKSVAIKNRNNVNAMLQSSTHGLNEVVVVGYGTQRKSDLTGSVASVSSEDLQKRPAINLEQELEGKAAGVRVSTNSGRPGGNTSIRIRGYSSINASNAPLYVVDGIVMTNGIETLNPNDIASIEVLKDASATAIYGTRGSNGVILITTKRGKKGGVVSYNAYVSAGIMAHKLPVLNSQQFLETEDIGYQNISKFDPQGWANGDYANKDPKIKRTALIGKLFDENLNPLYNIDWQDATTRTAISQSHNLSFTGGTEKTNYGLFLNYANDQGIILNSYQKRYSARLAIDNQMKDWLKVGATFNYSNFDERLQDAAVGGNNIPRMLIEMITIVPIKYPDGTYGSRTDYPGMEAGDNPVALANEDKRLLKTNAFSGNTYADINFTPNLDLKSVFGINISSRYNPYFESDKVTLTAGNKNYAEIWTYQNQFWQWQNYLTYKKQINPDNNINVLLGAELQHNNYLQYFVGTEDMPDNFYQYYNLATGATPHTPQSYGSAWQMASFFGRLNYNYKDKWLFTATGRADGSSRFGKANKFAFFPSAALAWRMSQEDFLKDSRSISDLKLRASYGLTGNSEIGEYQSLARLGTNTYVIDGQRASGTVISTLANPDLRWEKTAEYDLGISLGLYDSRISFEGDVYLKKTKDLLLSAPVPTQSGYGSIYKNIGSMQNKGLELTLNTVNIQSANFSWNTSFNISI